MCNSENWSQRAITSQNKKSNNSETVWDTRNVSMNHDYENVVTFSHFVNKTCVKRPLAEKSRWRHIRLAIKPRNLGNHASQIKSYYRTLSWSHGRSFRICHKKSPEAPPSGKITMTSYPVGNETSLSRKPCVPDEKFIWTLSVSHGRSFRNRHENLPEAPPGVEIPMMSDPACNKSTLSRKPCIADKKLLLITITKSWSHFQNPSWKIAWSVSWRRNDDDVISYL